MATFQSKAYATSTQCSYSSHLKNYLQFCNEFDFLPVPASHGQIELYIVYLSESLKYSSIVKYLNIIHLLHVESYLPNPMENSFGIKAPLKGVRRELGDTVISKLPITPEILVNNTCHIGFQQDSDIMFWEACLVGFHAMLRKANLFPPTSVLFDVDKHLSHKDIEMTS